MAALNSKICGHYLRLFPENAQTKKTGTTNLRDTGFSIKSLQQKLQSRYS